MTGNQIRFSPNFFCDSNLFHHYLLHKAEIHVVDKILCNIDISLQHHFRPCQVFATSKYGNTKYLWLFRERVEDGGELYKKN